MSCLDKARKIVLTVESMQEMHSELLNLGCDDEYPDQLRQISSFLNQLHRHTYRDLAALEEACIKKTGTRRYPYPQYK